VLWGAYLIDWYFGFLSGEGYSPLAVGKKDLYLLNESISRYQRIFSMSEMLS
jgi:hypothetical protein